MKTLLLAVLWSALFGAAAAAQEPAAPPDARAFGADSNPGRRAIDPEMRQRLEELRKRQLAEYLRLAPQEAEALERELQEFRTRQMQLRQERMRLLEELRDAFEADSAALREDREELREESEKALRERLDALRLNDEERARALSELRERLARQLSLEQQARLQVFAEGFQSRLLEGARRLRAQREEMGRSGRAPPERHDRRR